MKTTKKILSTALTQESINQLKDLSNHLQENNSQISEKPLRFAHGLSFWLISSFRT